MRKLFNLLIMMSLVMVWLLIACAEFEFDNPVDPDIVKDPPQLMSPADNLSTNDSTPSFSWAQDDQVEAYWLQVDNNSNFSSPEINRSDIKTNSCTSTVTLSDGQYDWRVCVNYGEDAWKDWTSNRHFTLDTQGPAGPTLSSPSNSSTINDNTPSFDWSDVSGSSLYELEVDNSSSFTSPEINQETLTVSNYTAVTSLADGTWYWRVRCKDSLENWGSWSEIGNYIIDTEGPSGPTLSSPANGATGISTSATLYWNSVSGASSYGLQISTNSSFTSLVTNTSGITSTSRAVSGLSEGETYYWRVNATGSGGTSSWSDYWYFTTVRSTGTVTDIDGNVYQTVKIGDQWWMVENLKVTHYRNGDAIPNVTDNFQWAYLTTGAYCNYENSTSNVSTYGRLYNWYAVNDNRNIAPSGWHVPTDEEWQTLIDYLGGDTGAGGKMKERGTTHWFSPNTGADNASGFTALPGGYRNYFDGNFYNLGGVAYFWSSTENNSEDAWGRNLYYDYSEVDRYNDYEQHGFSLRLVRDNVRPANTLGSGGTLHN